MSREKKEHVPESEPAEAETPAPAALKRRRRWRSWLVLGMLSLLSLSVGWLSGSESGLRFACRGLGELTAGVLSLENPEGRLVGPFSVQTVHWHDDTLDVRLHALEVDWLPRELLYGRLFIRRLAVAEMRVVHAGRHEPSDPPTTLRLPLEVNVEELVIARIAGGDSSDPAGPGVDLGTDLSGRWVSDSRLHRLTLHHARTAGLGVAGEMALAADAPFALTVASRISTVVGDRPLVFELAGAGVLTDFTLAGTMHGDDADDQRSPGGEISLHLNPFAPQPVHSLAVRLSHFDPATWIVGAPAADLDLRAEMQSPAGDHSLLSGRLVVRNYRPGTLDRGELPIRSVTSVLRLGEEDLRAESLAIELTAGGRLQGDATLRDHLLDLHLDARKLDLGGLDARLRQTQLAGALAATLGLQRQSVAIDLRDFRMAIQGRLAATPEGITVEHLRLTASGAQLTADGSFTFAGQGRFALQGSLQDFDPSRFARLPAARVNGALELHGSLQPHPAFDLRFQLRDSRFRGERLHGSGAIGFADGHLHNVQVELMAAGNRLSAQGSFGALGEALQIGITAPRLDSLGIGGDLDGRLLLAGSSDLPEVQGYLRSARLSLPGSFQMRGLDLEARLAAGRQGALSGKLHMTVIDLPAVGRLRDLKLDIEGVRSQQRLRGQVGLARAREFHLLLAGGVSTAQSGWAWEGALSELNLSRAGDSAQSFLRLTAPMPLRVAAGSLSCGPALLTGTDWTLHVQQARYEHSVWRWAGNMHGFPVTEILSEFPGAYGTLAAAVKGGGNPLRIAAEWDVGTGATAHGSSVLLPTGRVHVWREGGEVMLGALPLGLQEADLGLDLVAGNVRTKVRVRGRRLGEVDGELIVTRGGVDTLVDRRAPWHGRWRLDSPDLAWAGPLLGDGWQVAGRLTGELSVDGTPAQPRLSGEWRGEQLAVRSLDQGTRLERGSLLLQLASESGLPILTLKHLVFESERQPEPRPMLPDSRLVGASVAAGPGRLEAKGELRPGGQLDGFLTIRAEHLGVLQRPDQWLLVSGDGQVKMGEHALEILGSVRVDAGYWQLAKTSTPRLSDDVVVHQGGNGERQALTPIRLMTVNLDADLGRNFHFSGAGVDSRLVGSVRLRSENSGPLHATGTIRTRDGRFDAYGQQLEIERGILNFQGLLDNPGLNILAVRRHLPVEAGVEITGTARRPQVRLVSDPDVPDAEKLSWLVLGQGPEQQGGRDATVLMAAAQSLLGGQQGGPLKAIQRSLGIDEFGLRTGNLEGSGRWPGSRIANTSGFGSTETTTDQIVSIGKRLSSNVVLSYDQSLNAAGSVIKLTVDLTRNFSLVGRAGTDSGMDLLWSHRFGR